MTITYKHETFPWKLYRMLNEAESEGYDQIISWVAGTNYFKVHDSKAFVDFVMSKHFGQTRFKSFLRQLNLYCFKRVTSGPLNGAYSHPLFIRGQVQLCSFIVRVKDKQTAAYRKYLLDSIRYNQEPSGTAPAIQENSMPALEDLSLLDNNNMTKLRDINETNTFPMEHLELLQPRALSNSCSGIPNKMLQNIDGTSSFGSIANLELDFADDIIDIFGCGSSSSSSISR